jgi:putative transposase
MPYHVYQRGNRKLNIFHDDEDKAFYMKRFMYFKRQKRVKLYAWCLMDNHVHFVLEPQNLKSLYKLFLCLNTSYVAYYNKKYNTTGKLFGNRYCSCILDHEHFYNAMRYVELNPIKAGMVSSLEDYYWSSTQENLGLRNRYYLSKLPNAFKSLILRWKEYLLEGLMIEKQQIQEVFQNIKRSTFKGLPAGGIDFIKHLEKLLGIDLIMRPRGRPKEI